MPAWSKYPRSNLHGHPPLRTEARPLAHGCPLRSRERALAAWMPKRGCGGAAVLAQGRRSHAFAPADHPGGCRLGASGPPAIRRASLRRRCAVAGLAEVADVLRVRRLSDHLMSMTQGREVFQTPTLRVRVALACFGACVAVIPCKGNSPLSRSLMQVARDGKTCASSCACAGRVPAMQLSHLQHCTIRLGVSAVTVDS